MNGVFVTAESAGVGSSICTSCGLCCDGAIFATAHSPDVSDRVALLVHTDSSSTWRLGCTALTNRCCSIYEERPLICRAFKCHLLSSVEAGKVSIETARSVVQALHDELEFLGVATRPAGTSLEDQVATIAPEMLRRATDGDLVAIEWLTRLGVFRAMVNRYIIAASLRVMPSSS